MRFLLTIFSALALMSFSMLISVDSLTLTSTFFRGKEAVSSLCLLLIFLFVPMGCLPAFVNFPYSICIVFLLFCVALVVEFYAKKTDVKILLSLFAAFISLLCVMHIAQESGFPGYAYTLNFISSVNLWKYTDIGGKAFTLLSGFFILCAAFLSAKTYKSVFAQLFVAVCCAIFVSFTIIPAIVGLIDCAVIWQFVWGYVSFWCAVLILKKVIFRFANGTTED